MCFDSPSVDAPSGADDIAYQTGRGDPAAIPDTRGNNPATGGASNGAQAAALLGLGSSASGVGGIQAAKGSAEFAGQNAGGFDTFGGKSAAVGQNMANHPGRSLALSLVPGGSIVNAFLNASELGFGQSPESIAFGSPGSEGADGGFGDQVAGGISAPSDSSQSTETATAQPVSPSTSSGAVSTAARAAASSPTASLLNPYKTLDDSASGGGPTGSTVSDQVLFNKGKNSRVVN